MGPIWTVVVAAGTGSRFGRTVPKQFVKVAGRTVVDWSIAAAAPVCDGLVIVVPQGGNHPWVSPSLPVSARCVEIRTVAGGATRSESVRRGLGEVPASAEVIVIHDAARPLASAELFACVVETVQRGADGAIPAIAVVDTVRHVDSGAVDRGKLLLVQTPQAFDADALRHAHAGGAEATDDATLVEAAGGRIATVPGERWNIKLTEPLDEAVIAALLRERY